jgi:hypothetical protein
MTQSNVIVFPRHADPDHPALVVSRDRPCAACGHNTATLRRYPLSRAAAWCCSRCQALVRSRARPFIPHAELRACGIEPDRLPEVRR